jgi:uncharacterized membrane protein YidH (DUF202 family)
MASRRTQQLDMLLIITMLILFGIMKLEVGTSRWRQRKSNC